MPADDSGYEGRGHSLWYCDAREAGRYQWFETAFTLSPF
jgi:eukaryotic-like serine/threonine-protein kinase